MFGRITLIYKCMCHLLMLCIHVYYFFNTTLAVISNTVLGGSRTYTHMSQGYGLPWIARDILLDPQIHEIYWSGQRFKF